MQSNWQERTQLMLGDAALTRLNNAHVLIAGLGGVGAMVAEMLCRAGIGTLTIADADKIQSSNRNRQILALSSSEGIAKTRVMADRLLDINPDIDINVFNHYLKDQIIIDLLSQPFDYVVDAIDTLSPKLYFVYYALMNKHKLVSSMGAGGKLEPSLVKIGDISESYQCKLAFDLRKRLRRKGITSGFKVVFSSEPVPGHTIIIDESEKNKKSNVGTISYMPAIFGCYCASVVIRDLINGDNSVSNS
ncbi:MAG: tRNA threonylcarbamoyladenosine dehydratase [Bacteroidales bacterium]|jgi:tRNA A37 threonylcarbamoyladenosine dehydratase|nr:tRNA threonylcarbamoyladenosine dehydratase [Bacteroidales bacterium]